MSNDKNKDVVWSELAIEDLGSKFAPKFTASLKAHEKLSADDKALIAEYTAAVADQIPADMQLVLIYKWGTFRYSIQPKTARKSSSKASALIPRK